VNKFKAYCTRFIREDDGIELIEVAIAVAIVAILAAGVLGIVSVLQGKISDARTLIDGINVSDYQSGGSGNHSSGTGGINTGVGGD